MKTEDLREQIKEWVRRKLHIDEEHSILISETGYANGQNRTTVIMVFPNGNISKMNRYLLEKPLEEVTKKDIRQKIEMPLGSEHSCENPSHHHDHERKAKTVVLINVLAVVLEIGIGYHSHSMALLADGWHMASHVFAIGLCWIAYYFARRHKANEKFKNGTAKILSLAGYTSAVVLLIVAFLMSVESIERLIHPETIKFKEAVLVAIIGLVVNAISAKVLHHDHDHGDHNIRAAYFHVLADMLTSIAAIVSLLIGYYFDWIAFDAIVGIISSVVIIKWAIGLMKNSGKELLDYGK